MSLKITSLASGSSGNAFLVETTGQALLVDAGLGARTLERYLRRSSVEPAALGAIVVSHEHHDHACGAGPLARRYGIPLVCSAGTAEALQREWTGLDIRRLDEDGLAVGDVDLWGFPLPHDAAAPQGILLEHGGYRAGWAVDLGHVPDDLATNLAHADLVIVEANHDKQKLIASGYPWGIKNRIMSDYGHLSNLQAAELLAQIAADGRQRSVWLAHLSKNTNDAPRGVLRTVEAYLDVAGVKNLRLAIAGRDRPSVSWRSDAALSQATLFDPV